MNRIQQFINYYNGEPLIIQLVWLVACMLFFTTLIFIIYLKILRVKLRKNEKLTTKLSKEYELLLITYLYAESNEDGEISSEQKDVIDKLKESISNKFKREIVVSSFLKLTNEITGEMAESIYNLYANTKLKKYALAKLSSRKWHVIAGGIRELTLFNVKEAHDKVIKHVNHSKKEIRKEVQLYLVNLFNFEGLSFLNDLKTPLSEWDQIQLLEELQKSEDQQIPDITAWLNSTNDYVVIFALKLAKIYNQFGMKEVLIDLINHESEKVRLELLPVLSYLHVLESKEILKNNFNSRTKDEKIAFFQLLEELGSPEDEPFILKHIHNSNFEIKFSALKILKNINIEKFRSFNLVPPESEFVKMVLFIENN